MTAKRVDIAVLVGRFQPFHQAHLTLLRRALEEAPQCVVVIGSAYQARTPKNPFTWTERAEMIRMALSAVERPRVRFMPIRDHYDQACWVRAVRDGVAALTSADPGLPEPSVGLVGHHKDASSDYLHGFSEWALISMERVGGSDGTELRDALFASEPSQLEATLAAMAEQLPQSTSAFLRAWAERPFMCALAAEWRMLRDYKLAWRAAPYPPVFVTVDAVVRCKGHVLLIQRGKAPGLGLYAVPGGFIEPRETAYQSALRELSEETHLSVPAETMRQSLQGSAVFDHPDRSLRGRTITHAFFFDLGDRDLPEVRADDDAQCAQWILLTRIAQLEDRFYDDHFHMLDHFLSVSSDTRKSG